MPVLVGHLLVDDALQAELGSVEVGAVELVDGNAAAFLESLGGLVVGIVDGDHVVARLLQGDRARGADAARTTRNNRNVVGIVSHF